MARPSKEDRSIVGELQRLHQHFFVKTDPITRWRIAGDSRVLSRLDGCTVRVDGVFRHGLIEIEDIRLVSDD